MDLRSAASIYSFRCRLCMETPCCHGLTRGRRWGSHLVQLVWYSLVSRGRPWVAQIQQLSVGLSRMDGHGPNASQQELAWCWALIKLNMIPYAMPLTATVGLPRITKDYRSSFMLTTNVVRLVAAVVLWGCLPACFELPFMRQPWLCHGIGEQDEIDGTNNMM